MKRAALGLLALAGFGFLVAALFGHGAMCADLPTTIGVLCMIGGTGGLAILLILAAFRAAWRHDHPGRTDVEQLP